MKNQLINLTVPPGMRYITVGFSETIEEGDDAVRAAFDSVENGGVASVDMAQREDVHKHKATTGLDILRMRGTPIEMIYSTLIAGDNEGANAMFRTTILEYVFEKIAESYQGDDIRFINSRQLTRRSDSNSVNDQCGVVVDGPGQGIPFTPEFDAIPFKNKGFVPICNIDAGRVHPVITDDGNTAIITVIEEISERVLYAIRAGVNEADVKKKTVIQFRIGTDLSTIAIKSDGVRSIDAEASIAMLAYIPRMN